MNDSGRTSDPIYCQNCGNDMPPVSDFCDECGLEVGAGAGVETNVRLKAAGIISGALSLILLPIVLGPLSILCGYLLYDRGETGWGKALAAGGFAATMIGTALALVLTSLVQQCGVAA